MSLLSRYLPDHQFAERHHIRVASTAKRVLNAAVGFDPAQDPLVRRIMAAREFPARIAGVFGIEMTTKDRRPFGMADFVPLGRDGDREAAFGLVGRFWRMNFGLVPMADAAAFAAFDQPGVPKLALNFTATPENGAILLATETRVFCPDAPSRRRFAPYWTVIRPFSGFIRHRLLAAVKRAAEENHAPRSR